MVAQTERAVRRERRPRQWAALSVSGLLAALLLAPASPLAAEEPSISPSVAGLFVGEDKSIEGRVSAAEREGNTVRLRLGAPPHDVAVSLIIGLLSNFPPEPERYYNGKTVRVTGTIRSFRGATEVVIHDPASIQVMGEAGSAAAPPAAVQAPPAAASQPPPVAAGHAPSAAASQAPPVAAGQAPSTTASQAPADVAHPVPEPSAAPSLEALNERVRVLEERVRKLEHAARDGHPAAGKRQKRKPTR
jgi:hypothetical protein